MDNQIYQDLRKELKFHARGLSIPEGAADVFIDETIKKLSKNLKKKTVITENDFKRAVEKELKQYNKDLAYVYKNYDRII